MAFITKSYQNLFGVRSYINAFEFPSQTYIPYKVHHYGNSALPYLHHDL